VLPQSERGTIEARKNFHNLDKNRERILATPPKLNDGVWGICGVPELYQSVRCHGRNSIYEIAYSYMTENRKPKTENPS
jgi:hypothetical protein